MLQGIFKHLHIKPVFLYKIFWYSHFFKTMNLFNSIVKNAKKTRCLHKNTDIYIYIYIYFLMVFRSDYRYFIGVRGESTSEMSDKGYFFQ